jgi:hypothetical protein
MLELSVGHDAPIVEVREFLERPGGVSGRLA